MIRHLLNIAFLLAVILFFSPQMLCGNQVVAVSLDNSAEEMCAVPEVCSEAYLSCPAILKGTATLLLEARTRTPPHYSNSNGSYYYKNDNGSTYYNSGTGYSQYNSASGSTTSSYSKK